VHATAASEAGVHGSFQNGGGVAHKKALWKAELPVPTVSTTRPGELDSTS
jgi:hypothetical protein